MKKNTLVIAVLMCLSVATAYGVETNGVNAAPSNQGASALKNLSKDVDQFSVEFIDEKIKKEREKSRLEAQEAENKIQIASSTVKETEESIKESQNNVISEYEIVEESSEANANDKNQNANENVIVAQSEPESVGKVQANDNTTSNTNTSSNVETANTDSSKALVSNSEEPKNETQSTDEENTPLPKIKDIDKEAQDTLVALKEEQNAQKTSNAPKAEETLVAINEEIKAQKESGAIAKSDDPLVEAEETLEAIEKEQKLLEEAKALKKANKEELAKTLDNDKESKAKSESKVSNETTEIAKEDVKEEAKEKVKEKEVKENLAANETEVPKVQAPEPIVANEKETPKEEEITKKAETPNSPKDAELADTTKVTQEAKEETKEQANDTLDASLDNEELAKMFPLPKAPKDVDFSLSQGSYLVESGTGTHRILRDLFKEEYKTLGITRNMFLVAIFRKNPTKFGDKGPLFPYDKAELLVPTVDEILLEDGDTFTNYLGVKDKELLVKNLPSLESNYAKKKAQVLKARKDYQNSLKK